MPIGTIKSIFYVGMVLFILIQAMTLLYMEGIGETIEWSGCGTPETRTFVTKFIVRGVLVACIAVGLLFRR